MATDLNVLQNADLHDFMFAAAVELRIANRRCAIVAGDIVRYCVVSKNDQYKQN